jgi:adenylate kinase family enzyme
VRIAVIGTSGSGKTTLAKALARRLALPCIELDAVNWQTGWRDLSRSEPDEFVRRVALAIAAEAWVVDGNYRLVRELIWRRATHVVWLDYARPIVMCRVMRRTLLRAALGTELWAGNRERWRHLLRPSHPIRWAWNTWPRHRREFAQQLAETEYSHLVVLRLHRARQAKELLRRLRQSPDPSALTGFRAAS